MSLIDQGRDELRERVAREVETAKYRAKANRQHCERRFRMDFCRDRYIAEVREHTMGGETYRHPTGSMIENPARPFPTMEFVAGDGGYSGTSTLLIRDGDDVLTFRVSWKYEGGGDRAYWDDGWWPTWELRVRRWPWPRWQKVYGAASIAAALGREP